MEGNVSYSLLTLNLGQEYKIFENLLTNVRYTLPEGYKLQCVRTMPQQELNFLVT